MWINESRQKDYDSLKTKIGFHYRGIRNKVFPYLGLNHHERQEALNPDLDLHIADLGTSFSLA